MKTTYIRLATGFFICLTNALALAQSTRPVSQLTNGELIDRLQDVSNSDYAVKTNVIGVGGGGQLPQGLRMMQDSGPKPAEIMQELVRRGASAVPDLCKHLDDARLTKATIKRFGPMEYSAEYDWNPRTGKARPTGVVARWNGQSNVKINGEPSREQYTLAVGDLCFQIIGQIVNREFQPVRYQPSAIEIVNSPVLCSDLCTAVRLEWSDLTVDRLCELLIKDVTEPDSRRRDSNGLKPLARYFPGSLPEAVRARLQLPMYDSDRINEFVRNSLYLDPDSALRQSKLDQFIKDNGPTNKDGLLVQLWNDKFYQLGQQEYEPGGPKMQVEPSKILLQFVDHVDPDYPPVTHSVRAEDTAYFIKALNGVPSTEIDAILFQEFKARSNQHSKNWEVDDTIAAACIKQLANKGNDVPLIDYCARRWREISDFDTKSEKLQPLILLLGAPPIKEP